MLSSLDHVSLRLRTIHIGSTDIVHCLHLLRELLSFGDGDRVMKDGKLLGWEQMPCATNLVEAGIKLKKGDYNNGLYIKFKDGVLEIPPMIVDDMTEAFFRNIICFEQCWPGCTAKFTSYAIILDNLINTTKDIDIL
ncbi:hypothetical protein Ddye_000074 [Dipteronia dyeriana]|uniref:Uncharacterized protein n=1 Tax=Dipteronia dyeriana TaxID=168575 RepID=A0AAD9XL46_9ROSI|nr:hypothetical protein Ddye_000074 [Dipteronia dyeriana]